MKKPSEKKQPIDNLLIQTLKDDLSPELEAQMKKQISQFNAKPGEVHPKQNRSEIYRLISNGVIKTAMAAVAVLMVILGGIMQAKGTQSALADNITLTGTAVLVLDRINNSQAMECSAQLYNGDQISRQYRIQWISPQKIQVQAIAPDGNSYTTILSGEDFSREIQDPWLASILELLSPDNLADQLDGTWTVLYRQKQQDCDWETYAVRKSSDSLPWEMTVDLCTYLPNQIERLHNNQLMQIQLKWN